MKLRDLFVPKFVHSDPNVRIDFINKSTDTVLLNSIIEKDQDKTVVQAAQKRVNTLIAAQAAKE